MPTCHGEASGCHPEPVEGHGRACRGLLALLLAGCTAHAAAVKPLAVSQVVSAHHGVCPAASNRVYGERVARLFSQPLLYRPYNCMSHSEAKILADAACARHPRNTVFITLKNPIGVAFTNERGSGEYATFRTFGAQFDPRLPAGRTSLYIPVFAFPKPPPPPGTTLKPYHGPVMYGGFGYRGDLLDLAPAECPVS